MKLKQIYFWVFIVLVIAFLCGFLLPILFSARSTVAVLLGIIIIATVLPYGFYRLYNFYSKLIKKPQQ